MHDISADHHDRNGTDRVRPKLLSDRQPPHNIEAEIGVIGAVILDNQAMHDVSMILRPSDFFRDSHATIYRIILSLYDAGEPFEAWTISERLGDQLASVGGNETLGDIVNSVTSGAMAKYFAQVVRQKSLGRELIECANGMLSDGYSGKYTAEQLIEMAEKRIYAISDSDVKGETMTASDAVSLALERIKVREAGEVTGVMTGLYDLDDMTDGLQPGNLVVIAARPSQGKTALALNIADHVAVKCGVATLFVSLEMNELEVGERLISSRARIDNYKFKNPALMTPADREAMGVAQGEIFRNPRLFIDATPSRSVTQIAANARRHKAKHSLGLVIVDYIQLIDGQRHKTESRQEEVARISKRLKGLARELQVPVVALAQLNRESEKRDGHRPRLADLRESGQIEADADVVLLLHHPCKYNMDDRPNEADLIVAKNRNGACGTVQLMFVDYCTKFENKAPDRLVDPMGDERPY